MLDKSSIVSVVVVNHNGKEYLKTCLQSIESQDYSPKEVIVIDNASRDGSIQMVEKEFPQVYLIKNKNNSYFGPAHNQGINASKGEFILCLNNDIILDKNFIRCLIENNDFDSRIGIWGGKILRIDQKTIDTTGLFLGKNRKPIERGYSKKDNGQYNKKEYVFGIGGAAVLLSKEMLNDIKINGEYFDEDFRIFYDDLDLCWRANSFGWKAYYVPTALAYHKRGGTVQVEKPKFNPLKKFHFAYLPLELQTYVVKNRYLTIIKNDNLKDFIKNFIFIIFYDIMLFSYILVFRPRIFFGLFKYSGNFKKAFLKRKAILQRVINLRKK